MQWLATLRADWSDPDQTLLMQAMAYRGDGAEQAPAIEGPQTRVRLVDVPRPMAAAWRRSRGATGQPQASTSRSGIVTPLLRK